MARRLKVDVTISSIRSLLRNKMRSAIESCEAYITSDEVKSVLSKYIDFDSDEPDSVKCHEALEYEGNVLSEEHPTTVEESSYHSTNLSLTAQA